MQLSRLFELVYLLLDRKGMTADELAEHFEVSRRTIYRDVDTLAQAGIPIYAERGKGGGIRLTEQFVLNKSVLSAEERRSLLAALRGMEAVGPGAWGRCWTSSPPSSAGRRRTGSRWTSPPGAPTAR